jgi:hypothetical protein
MSAKAPQYDPSDPSWLRVWKTFGIRWLGPKGHGTADAMERWKHGFEHGLREGARRAQLIALSNEVGSLELELSTQKLRLKNLKKELQ